MFREDSPGAAGQLPGSAALFLWDTGFSERSGLKHGFGNHRGLPLRDTSIPAGLLVSVRGRSRWFNLLRMRLLSRTPTRTLLSLPSHSAVSDTFCPEARIE
jgi:hypothetical protein